MLLLPVLLHPFCSKHQIAYRPEQHTQSKTQIDCCYRWMLKPYFMEDMGQWLQRAWIQQPTNNSLMTRYTQNWKYITLMSIEKSIYLQLKVTRTQQKLSLKSKKEKNPDTEQWRRKTQKGRSSSKSAVRLMVWREVRVSQLFSDHQQ